ncbi:patatin-like phospholipase family protein [Bradyrhizobium sp. Ai1a-2]|uniref:patatin-like phospholipase family protein n=1 Tax=Bradyrhizobium sp. Ai1a-2 TaxID=196490 RepID=UPI0004158CCF|nr:patatin-like phospholipase family protein [Bradyrhizobium sp. Ai1a-2]
MDDNHTINQEPVFQIGLALSGAISAGAYTAGVLDFLFQALFEWDAHRGEPGVPNHRVVLKVIAGASAGAITGALGAIALARGIQPCEFDKNQIKDRYPDTYTTHQRFLCVLPPLYRTWVELPRMVGADGTGGLLGTADIEANRTHNPPIVRSLLDASVLEEIKRAAIEPNQSSPAKFASYSFIANDLHVFITISNMRGIPFRVAFGRNSYGMQTVGDRIHYVLNDLGQCKLGNNNLWLESDTLNASHQISIRTLPTKKDTDLGEWDLYGTAALASGAFPVGLSCRRLDLPWAHYMNRQYPIPVPADVEIQPDFPPGTQERYKSFAFESIDGGLVNNDPFDYAQFALTGGPAVPASGEMVEKAIIMVAPFPEPPDFLPENSPSPALTAIVRALFPALVNQARFRSSELAPAVNERDFSRFLIAPSRRMPRAGSRGAPMEHSKTEKFAIACGLLGGFGGFLDEKFRAHDFQLGRRNCQYFLQKSFLVPPNNKIVGRRGLTELQPVIPLLGSAADPVPLPRWPQMSQANFDLLSRRLKARVSAIAPRLIDAQTSSVKLRAALKFGWVTFVRSHVLNLIQQTILADLVRRGQIEGWNVPSGGSSTDVNSIIAELVNPACDLRTPQRIAQKTALPAEFVQTVLEQLSRGSVTGPVRVWKGDYGYALYSRRPTFLARRPLVGWFNRWWKRSNNTLGIRSHDQS